MVDVGTLKVLRPNTLSWSECAIKLSDAIVWGCGKLFDSVQDPGNVLHN